METERKSGKKDLLLIGGILTVALLMFLASSLFFGGQGTEALISINGKEVMQVNLSSTEQREIDLKKDYGVGVVLEVKDHEIRFLSADCPDKLCMGFGYVSKETESAVCMPNRVAISIVKR